MSTIKANSLPPELPTKQHTIKHMQTDVSDEAQVQALVAEAVKWGGSVDLYVNNAAKFAFGTINTVSNVGMRLLQGCRLGCPYSSLCQIAVKLLTIKTMPISVILDLFTCSAILRMLCS